MPNPFSTQTPLPTPPVMPGQGAGPMGAPPPGPAPAGPPGGAPPIDPLAAMAPPAPPTVTDPAAKGFVPPSSGMGSMGGIDRNLLAQLMAKTGGGAVTPSPLGDLSPLGV